MRLARFLAVPLAVIAITTCGSPSYSLSASTAGPPPCARTFVVAITSSDPTPGVWACLSDSYRNRLQGQGDYVFALATPLWTRYRYLGQDHNIAMFDLTVNARVEPAVYNPPVSHVIMAVYLDAQGRVDHAKAATPI
jgi:hypothetical protein